MHTDRIYTIGHSNRSVTDFVELLSVYAMQILVDVRALPYSGRCLHFNTDTLRQTLEGAGIKYHWAGRQLGGMRKPKPDSPHLALVEGLRGYADYMGSQSFGQAIDQLIKLGASNPVVVMCAERGPMQCHRSLMADFLVKYKGVQVMHIVTVRECQPHRLRPELDLVQLKDDRLVYDHNVQGTLDLGALG